VLPRELFPFYTSPVILPLDTEQPEILTQMQHKSIGLQKHALFLSLNFFKYRPAPLKDY